MLLVSSLTRLGMPATLEVDAGYLPMPRNRSDYLTLSQAHNDSDLDRQVPVTPISSLFVLPLILCA